MKLSSQTEPIFLRLTKDPRQQRNGVVLQGVEVNPDTWGKVDAKSYYIVEILDSDTDVYIGELGTGAVCKIIPETLLTKKIEMNGFPLTRYMATAHNFLLVRSHGKFIINLLADNSKFRSIGQVKAQKLWDFLGEELYEILDSGDIDSATKNLRQSLIIWVYLHRQHGCIPEYVLRHSCVGFKVEL